MRGSNIQNIEDIKANKDGNEWLKGEKKKWILVVGRMRRGQNVTKKVMDLYKKRF